MVRRKSILYCLILMVVLLFGCTVLSVGQTQARYINTVVWNTYVEPVADEPAVEPMTFDGEQTLTVLLGEMNKESDSVAFYFRSRTDASGILTWSVDPDLEIRLQDGDTVLEQDGKLDLQAGIPRKMIMVLKLTEQAPSEARDARTVQITVNWTEIPGEELTEAGPQILTATFRVELPAVEEPTEPPTEEPTEAPTEDPGEDPTEEPTGDPGEEPSEEPTEDPGEEPSEEPTGDPVEEPAEEPIEDPGEEPSEEPTEAPVEEASEESTGEPGEEPAENEEITDEIPEQAPPEEKPAQTVLLETPVYMDPAQVIPVWITAENGAAIRLGSGFCIDAVSPVEMREFPRYTRYSLDGGENWFLLYKADTVLLELTSETPNPDGTAACLVLLDLSDTALLPETSVMLMAEGWSETTSPGHGTATVTPLSQPCWLASRVMTREVPLQLSLTPYWPVSTEELPTNYELTYSVEKLTVTGTAEEGYMKEYESVDPAQGSLIMELTAGETEQILTIRTGDSMPAPGTYRVSLSWTYKGICVGQKQMTFFINYPRIIDTAQTGGAEQ